jgi:hypothetical protein
VTQLAGSVRHILPNIVPPIIVQGTLAIAAGQPVVSRPGAAAAGAVGDDLRDALDSRGR